MGINGGGDNRGGNNEDGNDNTENETSSFQGVLVTDFLASYNTYNGFHQRCWVHFLRDIKKLKKETGSKHPPLNIWAKRIRQIYNEAKNWKEPDSNLQIGIQAQERIEKENYFKDKLREACKPYTLRETPMTTLSQRAMTFLPELFTFIRFEGINPDNNQAERALRHSVVRRKISGGTRSTKGSHTREVLASSNSNYNKHFKTNSFPGWELKTKRFSSVNAQLIFSGFTPPKPLLAVSRRSKSVG